MVGSLMIVLERLKDRLGNRAATCGYRRSV